MIRALSILVVVAHPDDEVLGCGGYLAAVSDAHPGHDAPAVRVLILADGETSRDRDPAVEARYQMTERALDSLGPIVAEFAGLPDQRLDERSLLDLNRIIESAVIRHRPTLVLTHHIGDLNNDHTLVARATQTACRPVAGSTVRALMAFEVPSSTEWGFDRTGIGFRPDTFVPINVDRKLAAMACYAPEMRPHPHPRSAEAIRALATWRGAQSGLPSAEAFSTVWRRVD